MKGKVDPHRKPILRAKVREVLKMAPNRRFSEAMLLDSVNVLIPEPAEPAELREALEWNQGSGFVDYQYNRDFERDEWFLTQRGKEKA